MTSSESHNGYDKWKKMENAIHLKAFYTFPAVKTESKSGLKFVWRQNSFISSLLEQKIENATLKVCCSSVVYNGS